MKKLKINFWLQRHRKLLVFVMSFVALYMTIVGMTKMDFCTLTENAGLFGVVGTLLGAFIGGVFSLMGSVWVNNKQQKAAQNIKRKGRKCNKCDFENIYERICSYFNSA